ncbi:MarC family protein [Camelimonas abortus]
MIPDQNLWTTQLLTLLAVLEPIGHLSLFLAATSHLNARQKRRAAVIAVAMSYVVILVFGLIGMRLLEAMEVSLLSFQIAGGLIMLAFAGVMVLGPPQPASKEEVAVHENEAAERQSALETAIYPLAVPIIAGPGALLSVVVTLPPSSIQP